VNCALQEKLAGFKLRQDLDEGDRNPDELTEVDKITFAPHIRQKKTKKTSNRTGVRRNTRGKTFNPNIRYEE
jgi:hypothetical protein